jgi:hypothetical protein
MASFFITTFSSMMLGVKFYATERRPFLIHCTRCKDSEILDLEKHKQILVNRT